MGRKTKKHDIPLEEWLETPTAILGQTVYDVLTSLYYGTNVSKGMSLTEYITYKYQTMVTDIEIRKSYGGDSKKSTKG